MGIIKMEDEVRGAEEMSKLTVSDERKCVLDQLNEFRLSNHLCDVSIVVKGREFHAHRGVLAAGGGFFGGLFSGNMKERTENQVELFQIDPEIMDDVLGYIYTGEIEITRDNAEQIIMAADFLLLDKLKNHADKFLAQFVRDLSPSDLLLVCQFADRYKCKIYEEATLKVVHENFEVVINESKDFLELSAEALEGIITLDDLVVSSEEVVYRVVMDWVKHKEDRRDTLYQLFSKVRLCSLSEEFMKSCVVKEPLLSSNPDCSSLLQQRMDNNNYNPLEIDIAHPRTCLDTHAKAIVLVQGFRNLELFCYIPSTNSYYRLHMVPLQDIRENIDLRKVKLLYYGASLFWILENYQDIIIVRHDLEMNSWSKVASIDFDGTSCGVTCLQGIIYIAGGVNDPDDEDLFLVDTVYYDFVFACDVSGFPAHCSVLNVAPLSTPRSHVHLVSDDNFLYALGGSHNDGVDEDDYHIVEQYNPKFNTWEGLSPMLAATSSYDSQCSLMHDKIFVIQNCNDEDYEGYPFDQMYEINTDSWSQIPRAPLKLYKDQSIITSHGSMMYLFDDWHITSLSYDLQKERWSEAMLSDPVKTLKAVHSEDIVNMLYHPHPSATVVRLRKSVLSTLDALNV